jgi:regulator of sigma E protease
VGFVLIASFGWDSISYWVQIIALVVLGLGAVIFVHELGHFLVAKWCGVKCEKFYIGFDIGGKRICRFRWGETEYGIGILPLGGYVKMLGQEDNPARAAEEIERARAAGQSIGEARARAFDPRSYLAKRVWQRMAIISAGVVMNVLFAFLIATVAYLSGVHYVPCVLGQVEPGSAGWEAGLHVGDEILRVEDQSNPWFQDLAAASALSDSAQGVEILVKREGVAEPFTVRVHPRKTEDSLAPVMGIGPTNELKLRAKDPTIDYLPAGKANPGFEPEDVIKAIEVASVVETVETYAEFQRVMYQNADKTLTIHVDRKGGEARIVVLPNHLLDLGLVMKMGRIASVQKGSPADQAGIKPNDALVLVDGQPAGDPMTLADRLLERAGDTVTLTIERGNTQFDVHTTLVRPTWVESLPRPGSPVSVPSLGVAVQVLNMVDHAQPGSPAASAGLKDGDEITRVELVVPARTPEEAEQVHYSDFSETNRNWPYVFGKALQESRPGTKVRLFLKTEQVVELTPVVCADRYYPIRGLGPTLLERVHQSENLAEAMERGFNETLKGITMIFKVIRGIAQGDVSAKGVSGPLGIAEAATDAAKKGLPDLLLLIAIISVNLAVVNSLPIPILDGGHMMFLLYEGLFRRPPSERIQIGLSWAGLIFVASLMLFVFFVDGERIITGWTQEHSLD